MKKLAKDPVFGMEVDIAETDLKSEYKGKTYYFCSAGCKENFKRNPEQFIG